MICTSSAANWPQLQQNATLTGITTDAVTPLPSGEQVIRRVLDRSATLAAVTNAPAWSYDKAQVMLKLGKDDKVEERTEKLYQVRIIQGVPFQRLVKVEGRDLTDSQIKKEDQRDAAFQKRLDGRDPKKAVTEHESFITTNIVNRFQFNTLRRELVHGHQTVMVSFEPRPGKDNGDIQARMLSSLAGTLWVDEETADVARLEVHLTKGFSLGVLGILGAIKECRMALVSKPMPDGTWLPEQTSLNLSSRMFLSNVRFQMTETSSNFTLGPLSQINQP
jgi:hypothetical protein